MRTSTDLVTNVSAVVIALCAVTLTLIAVRSHFTTGLYPRRVVEPSEPVRLEDWREIAMVGHRIGAENAPVTIVVFSDFECAACSYFATELYPNLREQFPDQTAMVFRHWPLATHRLAYAASRAAECAAAQGRFWTFHDTLYAQQALLGIKSFAEFAKEAGVLDLDSFEACTSQNSLIKVIEDDIKEATRIGGKGTPTVLVNNWLFLGGVTRERLVSTVEAILSDKNAPG